MKGKRKLNEAFSNIKSEITKKNQTSSEEKDDPFNQLNEDSFILSSKAIFKTLEKSNKLKLCKVTNLDSVYLYDELNTYKSTKSKGKYFLISFRSYTSENRVPRKIKNF